jgi:hypothetical protein
MAWTEENQITTNWNDPGSYIVLNNTFTTYDVAGVLYDTAGITYDWNIADTSQNSDFIWNQYTDVVTGWNEPNPFITTTIISAGTPMGLTLLFTYAEDVTITTDTTNSWNNTSDVETAWRENG